MDQMIDKRNKIEEKYQFLFMGTYAIHQFNNSTNK